MRIRFLEDREVKDHAGEVVQSFGAGEVVELSTASARRWIRRNCAEPFDGDVGEQEAPDEAPLSAAGDGESPGSGLEPPSSVSDQGQASAPATLSASDAPTAPGDAASSPSADESGPKAGQSSTPRSPTSSTQQTRTGGGGRRTRRGSKG